ncbi:Capsular polysaccharide biosynthesis protein [Carnobacterium alterfunditum]|uniref:Capsular polysaccharide biosynthesis protein CpsC n=1 Tax=Carnobacterium alterfunditum TaxID=28230 RepID=A0A1N6HD61_9LACT|nr:Wzz/FepE/Etk N-terminal domain-containing protein [Carnobacterium alterfunditum]SIO17764.1 Capsular polysaccharide biosynthesis protein [Carnobacterium alterfunditum]
MMDTIGIIDLFKMIKKRWWVILLVSVMGVVLTTILTNYVLIPQYATTTQLLVSRKNVNTQSIALGEIETNIQMINTYRDIIEDPVVIDKVINELGNTLSEVELQKKIEIITQEDSQIFGIKVTDTNPNRAAEIANLVAATFQENIDGIINVENVAILSKAKANPDPVSPNLMLNQVVGVLIGFLLGMTLSIILETKDKKVHDEKIITEKLGWIHLGNITEMTPSEVAAEEKNHVITIATNHSKKVLGGD